MAAKFPESFADPLYAQLDSGNEQKLDLPVGLLSSIRTAGERSNASATNKFGTASPYQFTPPTRKAILDKYGIDVLLSPENASEGAGLLLQESLKRNKGDVETAVREYHGGVKSENWGPVNNAYAKRVLAAQGAAKTEALTSGFAKFMADNPAVPHGDLRPVSAAATAETAVPADDALAAGFGDFLKNKQRDQIMSEHGIDATLSYDQDGTVPAPRPAPAPEPTLIDKTIGGLETGATLLSGATTGTLGMLGGTIGGLAGSVMSGQFGTQEGVRNVEQAAGEGMTSGTYLPVTESGQQQAGAVGQAMQNAVPLMGLTAEMGALGKAAGAAGRAGADVGAATVQRIRTAAPAIAERVERTLRRNPTPETPTPGTLGSGGSAGTDMMAQRRALAEKVGIEPTYGQLTRDPQALRFELETAKGKHGAKLGERYSEQNAQIMQHFDNLVDMTGAEAADLAGTGRVVDAALRKELARDKAEVRVAYQKADKSQEAHAPVVLEDAVQFLNESAPDQAVSPLLVTARARALKLGIAAEGDGGNLVALPTTVKNAELFRRAVGSATDFEPTNIRNSAIIKGAVDGATEAIAGPMYRNARRLRENMGNKYEKQGVVSSLLNNKRGMNDRKVAIEDVFKHSILDASRADVSHVRRILQTGGESGQQAWRELQGATVNWIKDQAFSNTATDARGNVIMSVPKLQAAIKKLDAGGKLDFVFGKQGAEHMRDLNDLAKVIYTAPPGVVNHSNTASVLMAALTEAGVTGSMTGLPVPVLSALRLISQQVKNKRIQKRIDEALAGRAPSRPPRPTF